MWSKIPRLLEKRWWGPPVAFATLVGLFYLAIWAAIEPLDIPEQLFETPPPWVLGRPVYHIGAAIVLAAFAIVVYLSIHAKTSGPPHPVPREDNNAPAPTPVGADVPKVQEEHGEVLMEAYANKEVRIRYSEPFLAPPALIITIASVLGNEPILSDETAEGFTLTRPGFWAGGSRTTVRWTAKGRRQAE